MPRAPRLVMINPAPYNAEAPPGALAADITPTELHYVRSNFAGARARRHAGDRRRGGQPHDPDPRRPARDAGTGRDRDSGVCGERASRDAAAADRRALG